MFSNKRSDQFVIRPAIKEDACAMAPLIYAAIGDLAKFFTGSDTEDEAKNRLERLIEAEFTRFSYRLALVIEVQTPQRVGDLSSHGTRSNVIAIGSAFSSEFEQELTQATIDESLANGWVIEPYAFERLLRDREAPTNTYYIDHLAVSEAWQGNKLGTKLVHALVQRGAAEGHQRISLLADVSNLSAQRLYERLGFQDQGMINANGHWYHILVKSL